MRPMCRLAGVTLLLATTAALPARAAEGYDNCTGFIDALPAVITSQGVWCLNRHLTTAMTAGNAIEIQVNNVTLDCNDFKIGGLGAGDATDARGVFAASRSNTTVRNCSIRGFRSGIVLSGGRGNLVEDNHLDNNLYTGIFAIGEGNRIRRNRVLDTGGDADSAVAYGINASGDVTANTVANVFTVTGTPHGIQVSGAGSVAMDNRVRDLVPAGASEAHGIRATDAGITLRGNTISTIAGTLGRGIFGQGADTVCRHNLVNGFSTAFDSCDANYDNLTPL